jgi:hypothetical protein
MAYDPKKHDRFDVSIEIIEVNKNPGEVLGIRYWELQFIAQCE